MAGKGEATEQDKTRAIATIRAVAANGLLSRRETEERIEFAYRARSRAELVGMLRGLPQDPRAQAEVIATFGLATKSAKVRREHPWWYWKALFTTSAVVFWTIVWFVTGGSVGWLLAGIACSLMAFTWRFARGWKKQFVRR